MKKLIFLLLLFLILFIPRETYAYQQTEAVCYSQCAAHKFVWKGDFCWDLFTNQCSISGKDTVSKAISLLKDTAKAMATGKLMTIVDVSQVFKAWFVCKPLIEDCIVPQLSDCQNTCKNISQTYYAPNLSVGNPYGSIVYQNVYYDEDRHQLVFKVTNNGGYAWDIDVSASWGHTRNRDKMVSGGGTLFTEKIPEMLFFGARVGSPKTPGDYVTDFLIDESNFSGFLSRYKSDADNHYIPPAWYKTIPFTAPDGEFTKVILNVDPNQMIPESSEGDNTYILEIDKLPTLAFLSIEKLTFRRTDPNNLMNYIVDFDLVNKGEENGSAHVKWYLGNYETNKTPFHEQNMIVQGENKVVFSHIFDVDVSSGGDSCNWSQKYTLVVFDDEGFIKTRKEFSIPRFAGSIHGRVEDLFGKKVVGATVTASTGQTATVNDSGYYHIRGIPTLGKLTVTATHPDFSKAETKEVEIKFDDSKDKCNVEGLTQDGVNFVLKDQDVFFTITIKDGNGNPVNAHVLVTSKDWRFEEDINGNGPLSGMQPGEYLFTISVPGYKTISQSVNAVPNEQNLEFKMEKLNGRLTDGGLTIHQPQLLWQMDRGEEIVSQVTAAKDGNKVMLYTTRNKKDTGKLYFLNTETGSQIKVISGTLATRGQSQACLDTSYDGNTTALYVHDGNFGMAGKTRNVVKLFNSQGNEFGMADVQSGGGASECDVSPDGFYVYPARLMNKGMYLYTRFDIFGIEDSEQHVSYSSNGDLHFTTANNIVAGCPKGGGECVLTINRNVVANLGKIDSSVTSIDSSQDASKIGIITIKKAYLFSGSAKSWEKDIKIYGDPADISVSPGGKYVIYSTSSVSLPYRSIKIFTDNNIDRTPANLPHAGREDVIFVHANDKGIYFMTNYHKTLKFYKVGSYSVDYNQGQEQPTITPENHTSGLSYYSDGSYYPTGSESFASLEDGVIYIANRNIVLNMDSPNGSLNILEGTIFSVDQNHRPILLKGQLTADFNSPMIIYAIKFDRYDMNLFRTKLNQFRSGTLDSSEYFVVKNIHTRFTLTNSEGKFNLAVANGEVQVNGKKINETIRTGKQISIDKDNKIKQSIYLDNKIYAVIFVIIVLITGIVLFIYRKTKTGGKIIIILKKTGILFWKYFRISIIWFWKMIKKWTPVLWIYTKKLFGHLFNLLKNTTKPKVKT